jgi:hypothetical protein
MSSNSDALRTSTLATLGEIVDSENALKAKGIDVSESDDWMLLRDIVARIERRLARSTTEAAE